MKKLSIEEKAKLYDDRLERAKKWYDINTNEGYRGIFEDIFPELCESEDEKIKNEIIKFLELPHPQFVGKRHQEEWIAWLEKQGVKEISEVAESQSKQIMKEIAEFIYNSAFKPKDIKKKEKWLTWFEKQGEQKPTDKVKPRFKVRDKIYLKPEYRMPDDDTPIANTVFEIKAIDDKHYKFDGSYIFIEDQDKYELVEQKPTDKVEPKFHEGEWLVNIEYGNVVMVLEVLEDNYRLDFGGDTIGTLCTELADNDYRLWTIKDAKDGDVLASEDKVFLYNGKLDLRGRVYAYCGIYKTYDGLRFTKCAVGNYFTYKEPYPATKKQRDLLFQKMKEAGYEWDAEKKELKKIEQKQIIDYQDSFPKDNWELIREFVDKFGRIPKDEDELDVLVRYVLKRQNPIWTEEDDYNLQCIIAKVTSDIQKGNVGRNQELIDWLKPLKDRVGCEVNCTTKQEWKQENTGDLTDFENTMMHIGGSFFGQHAGLDPNDTNAIKEQANLLLELASSKEWSEEDEQFLLVCKNALAKYQTTDKWDACIVSQWLENKLKSLRPQINVTDEELAQAKKDAYNDVLNKIEYDTENPTFDDGWGAAIWYIKKKNINFQNTWKPSDEQIGVIEAVINNRSFQRRHLDSLYEQLKKLRE